MSRKILAVVFALLMVLAFAAGCKGKGSESSSSKKPKKSSSSSKISSVVSDSEDVSSSLAWDDQNDDDDEDDGDDNDNDNDEQLAHYKWSVRKRDNYFRDSAEAKVAATVSKSVKQYKNPGNVMMMSYHLSMNWCTGYGEDFESRKAEFQDIVNAGYFNSYFLSTNNYLLTEAEIIAKAGGTFWLGASKTFKKDLNDINAYIKDIKFYVDMLNEAGYGDIFLGFHWDEPCYGAMTSDDFLYQSEHLYKAFGKRIYPVFATGEFTDIEGNEQQLGQGAQKIGKCLPYACKYLTDAGFDSYSVDVREIKDGGVGNGTYINRMNQKYPQIVDGKSYYTTMREVLQKHVGHPVNFWYYPTSYETYTWAGTYADERFCLDHLNFMAEDLLKQEYPGGLCIYTFPRFKDVVGFEGHMNVKDSAGNYMITYGTKWETYSERLKEICKQFSGVKAKLSKLNV